MLAWEVGYTAHFVHKIFGEQNRGSTMQNLDRRAFLGTALATLPLAMLAQTGETKVRPVRVPSGEDRLGERHVYRSEFDCFQSLDG